MKELNLKAVPLKTGVEHIDVFLSNYSFFKKMDNSYEFSFSKIETTDFQQWIHQKFTDISEVFIIEHPKIFLKEIFNFWSEDKGFGNLLMNDLNDLLNEFDVYSVKVGSYFIKEKISRKKTILRKIIKSSELILTSEKGVFWLHFSKNEITK